MSGTQSSPLLRPPGFECYPTGLGTEPPLLPAGRRRYRGGGRDRRRPPRM